MRIRPVTAADAAEWLRLRMALWPECDSDADLANLTSQEAHRRLGYVETGRVVQFCKALEP